MARGNNEEPAVEGQRRATVVAEVTLDPPNQEAQELWENGLRLMEQLEGDWTLVGGLMVQLHAARYGQDSTRPTEDLDILGNSRRKPSVTERISQKLLDLGFKLTDITHSLTAGGADTGYRFTREKEVVDVLGPDGTKTEPKTADGYETIQVKGGTQALGRTETVNVTLGDLTVTIRTPTLLAALLLKARAIQSEHRDQDQEDLIVLLTCVQDPLEMRGELKGKEASWLRNAEAKLDLDSPALAPRFSTDELQRARATYTLLTQAASHR